MLWDALLGHQQQKRWFETALENGRLASSFLFVGPDGIGKRTFAILVAKGLLCRNSPAQSLVACGKCEDCAQVDAGTHPDLLAVAKPADKANIPIELLIGERDKRMRSGLCHDISLRPYSGRRKIAIIDDADTFNSEGANCLLKTLEEPPLGSLLILVGTSLQRQLPTIRSRCQAILFKPLEVEQLQTLLLRIGWAESESQALQLAVQSGGSLTEARLLLDPELDEFRGQLLEDLGKPQLPMMELAKRCGGIVDAAGKDARVKRERLKLVFRMAANFFRELSLSLSAEAVDKREGRGSDELLRAVQRGRGVWKSGPRGATLAWNRCLLATEQVDRNANQTTLLEAWAADIARLGGY